jgi:hypothetical protein
LVKSYCADMGLATMPLRELMNTTCPHRALSISNKVFVKT